MRRHVAASSDAPRRGWRLLASATTWLLLAAAAYLVWPPALGGNTSFVFVSGESMTPGYQPGDLLIAHKGEPVVGDVIVYAPDGFGGAQIVHRIIGGDAESGWVLQGDANDFIDPFTPTGEEVTGIVQVHIAGVGPVMEIALSPYLWVGVLLVGSALLLWPSRDADDDDSGSDDSDEEAREDADTPSLDAPSADESSTDAPAPEPAREPALVWSP